MYTHQVPDAVSSGTTDRRDQGSSLVSILIITLVAVMVLTAMVGLTGVVLLSVSSWRQSSDALLAAESTADDMLVRMLINPSTTPGASEFLGFANATGYPFVTQGIPPAPNTLIAKGISGNLIRTVRVQYTFDPNGKLIVISRQQVQ